MGRERRPALGDRRITLEHLRAFVSVAEGGGFQQAGLELHRSQSAITQSLKRLEEIIECRLVERCQGHIVGLTSDGRRFLPSAVEILARTNEAVSAMVQPQISGRITLGVPDDFRIMDLHGAISRCAALNRGLRIETVSALSSTLVSGVQKGDLDLAIFKQIDGQRTATAGRSSLLLRTEPLMWVANARSRFDSIAELPLVVFPPGCCYREAALVALAAKAKPSYPAYVSASYENVRAAISAGLGVGILPDSAVGADHIVLREADGFPRLPRVNLTMIEASGRKAVRQFRDFLRATVGRTSARADTIALDHAGSRMTAAE
ncbi:LysR family transcriptional regulator [Rhodopseudomonas palustris]|nr:LysR family transcriptional regulator [Rhodopseudomonas palustris]